MLLVGLELDVDWNSAAFNNVLLTVLNTGRLRCLGEFDCEIGTFPVRGMSLFSRRMLLAKARLLTRLSCVVVGV